MDGSSLIGSKPYISHPHTYTFDHRVDIYSKPMTVILHILVYHVKQLLLSIFYMHAITNLIISISCLIAYFLQIVEFIMQLKIYFMKVVKCMFDT
jgi:hypothetical protein